MAHRLVLRPQPGPSISADAVIGEIVAQTPVPVFEAPRADA
jgi:hypothetical protein